jgi:serine-type D-Ala-D-Ala endopeptidase (penicillin-binding protein 7)
MRNYSFGLVLLFVIIFCGFFASSKVLSEKDAASGLVLGISEAVSPEAYNFSALPTAGLKPSEPAPARCPVRVDYTDIDISAKAAVVIDTESGSVLYAKEAAATLPIASITKLATALTFLDFNPGWDKTYRLKRSDWRPGGRDNIKSGEEATVKDLFYLSLVASDNTATMALVQTTGKSEEEFVAAMNKKMAGLGLTGAHFSDPVGLSPGNTATAMEIAQLAIVALGQEQIKKASMAASYDLAIGGKKRRIYSTDSLLKEFPQNGVVLQGGKTGFIKAAGYCFVGRFQNEQGREVIGVVLGSNTPTARFTEAKKLAYWSFASYLWP